MMGVRITEKVFKQVWGSILLGLLCALYAISLLVGFVHILDAVAGLFL